MDLVDLQLALGRAPTLKTERWRALCGIVGDDDHPHGLSALYRSSGAVRGLLDSVDRHLIAEDRRLIESQGVHLLDLWSRAYPSQLAALPDAPVLLYVRGQVEALSSPQLAMVGSRQPTITGRHTALSFAAQLARAGLTITSGLAEGIDAASHQGALDAGGCSIAVLGTGIDQNYPRLHHELAQRIARCGALVSELPPRTPPLRRHFPLRNRIISGLALGVLVLEASPRSGSLLTARLARQQQRKLFAIPGSIHNPLSRGCHQLIRGGAWLTERPADVLQQLEISTPKQLFMDIAGEPGDGAGPARRLDKPYKILLDAVGFEATSIDELVQRTGLPSQSVASMLLSLELEGAVGRLADGRYMRLPSDNHATQRF